MNIDDFKKLVKNFTEENITSDEPHVSLRCEENSVTLEQVKRTILDPSTKIVRIVEDRPNVHKIYYYVSKRRELKIVVDTLQYNKLNVRTVKIIAGQFRIGHLPRRRF
jgi:hypothetical protein